MRRIVCLVMMLSVLLLALPSCDKKETNREVDEAVVIAAAADLIPKSDRINRIFWGTGIPILETEDAETVGKYTEADPAFLEENGFSNIEELKEMTSLVYDSVFCKTIFETKLGENDTAEDDKITYVRYYQTKKTSGGTTVYGPIMVHTMAVVYFDKPVVYHTDTLALCEVRGEIVYLTLDVTVLDDADQPVIQELVVALIEESDGWRLVNPTYDKYIEPKDEAVA